MWAAREDPRVTSAARVLRRPCQRERRAPRRGGARSHETEHEHGDPRVQQRLFTAAKPKKFALTACMRKLLAIPHVMARTVAWSADLVLAGA